LVSAQHDIDIAYQDALDNIRLKRARVDAEELPPKKELTEQQQKDTYVGFVSRNESTLTSRRISERM
jgi:chitin synthase